MNEPAISIRGLGKKYRLGMKQKPGQNFREALIDVLTSPVRRFRGLAEHGGEDDTFWALQDISFDVEPGDVVGVIGRNGAGKSTLLKILSRITEPTVGEAVIRGRLSSLLEVGTGFHKELTGRENIFLNGAILGMRRTEIARKFDEIVAFAEVEKFLDTPVKRYSSGMYVRLAFAVAAHLEPEILVVDEVLAVGDASFQKKCLGKMGEVARGGRTVVFVSHNMAAVQNLCTRGVVLKQGCLSFTGSSQDAVTHYLETTSDEPRIRNFLDRENAYLPGKLLITGAELTDLRGRSVDQISMGDGLRLGVHVDGLQDYEDAMVGFILRSATNQCIGRHNTGMQPATHRDPRQHHETFVFTQKELPLLPGSYWVDLSIARRASGRLDFIESAIGFDIIQSDVYGSGYAMKPIDGVMYFRGQWEAFGSDSAAPRSDHDAVA